MYDSVQAPQVWLVEFYGISTLVGYLMSNPVYIYIHLSVLKINSNITTPGNNFQQFLKTLG